MSKFVCIDIYWVSLSLDPHRTRQKPHFPNRPEYSLMTRSNSLLSREKFPVPARRELSSTALKLLSYSAHLLGPDPSRRLGVRLHLGTLQQKFPMRHTPKDPG